MIVAIHQPQYLPWLPYCDKADQCELLVHLDNVQFQRRGVQNRNQIKTATGPQWITVPVNASRSTNIQDVTIADPAWYRKHIGSIEHNYCRAPFFNLFVEQLRPILAAEWPNLCDMNIAVTDWMFGYLGITCKRVRASEMVVTGAKDELILGICETVGATVYLSGQGARDYQDEKKFHARGIDLRYQEYSNPAYLQCYPDIGFAPDLSALDLILNAGPQARDIMHSGRKPAELNAAS